MVNNEILSGIRAALERGQSLRSAMISFFNAGYNREEIEEAARALVEVGSNPNAEPIQVIAPVSNQVEQQKVQPKKPIPQKSLPVKIQPPVYIAPVNVIPAKPVAPPVLPVQVISSPVIPSKKVKEEKIRARPVQKVSDYGAPRRKTTNLTIIILVLLLIIFIGLLVSIFLFKQQLIDWLSTMF